MLSALGILPTTSRACFHMLASSCPSMLFAHTAPEESTSPMSPMRLMRLSMASSDPITPAQLQPGSFTEICQFSRDLKRRLHTRRAARAPSTGARCAKRKRLRDGVRLRCTSSKNSDMSLLS
eukprot:CAMPEP_0173416302 /NCGR_PEP_ID=MMETSP1356-20130122/85324_1 /TAXON_ID=77927 ORGANISM="Hemiselmis virescens, Strain PCC157" /NCGR_SAMPLE_ID=MMETSP1356 /ASSEMBLY_ACC=CAM_ASM_000847 /LENGTH=121 /DNA_ID=CAMNT_0014378609 /DNA_START=607 /DNA_END=969 /DNA_ORIENTATION=-